MDIVQVQDVDAEFEALSHPQEGVEQVTNAEDEFNRLVEALVPEDLEATATVTSVPAESNEDSPAIQEAEPETPAPQPLLKPNNIETVYPDTHTRFRGAEWFDLVRALDITLIGCGGIGSWTAFSLGRLGVQRLTLWDADKVESVNLAGQLFSRDDIGNSKVRSVAEKIYKFTGFGTTVKVMDVRWTRTSRLSSITIGALDNMDTRKELFAAWNYHHGNDSSALFIDGRLSANELQIFAIPGGDTEEHHRRVAEYTNKWLFDQSEGEPTVCSFKQTTYVAQIIGGLIANLVVNFAASQLEDAMYSVPFFTNYVSDIVFLKAINV